MADFLCAWKLTFWEIIFRTLTQGCEICEIFLSPIFSPWLSCTENGGIRNSLMADLGLTKRYDVGNARFIVF